MNWNLARGLVYLACLAASGLAMAGLADFDLATGSFDLRPFNLYALALLHNSVCLGFTT